MCVTFVETFFKVAVNVLKACSSIIWGNQTYPIAFACILPSIISPEVSVTSNTVGNALFLICRCRTHDLRLWTDCPLYASICTLGGLRFFSHSLPNSSLALWTGRMLQPAPVSTSQSV